MALITTPAIAARLQEMQGDINGYIPTTATGAARRKKIGYLEYLSSSLNTLELNRSYQDQSQDGEYRGVTLKYFPRISDGVVTDDPAASDCSKGPEWQRGIVSTAPTLYVEAKATIENEYMRQVIEGNVSHQDFIQDHFLQYSRALRTNINQKLLAAAGGAIGTNVPNIAVAGAYVDVELLDANGVPKPTMYMKIQNDMEDMGYNEGGAIFGLGKYRNYLQQLDIGAANDAGQDLGQVLEKSEGVPFFKDQTATTALAGADRVLVQTPGVAQYYTYNMNRGRFADVIGDTVYGTMPDPEIATIDYDYTLMWDKNCASGGRQGAWTIKWWLYFDLFVIPAALNGTDAFVNGTTGLFGYNVTQAV